MTQEEKAKAYDEAIGKLQGLINNTDKQGHIIISVEDIENSFPELKESEDDGIRKDIIRVLKGEISFTSEKENEKYIAWLEKQGEPNPYGMKETTWNKEDEENMNNILYILNQLKDTSSYEEDNIAENTINWLTSLKNRLCSSNEYDKDMLGAIIYCIKNNRQLEKEHIAWLEKHGTSYTNRDADKKELKIVDWSKHIKYNPNTPSITEEKPTWTEEDEKIRKEIIFALKFLETVLKWDFIEDIEIGMSDVYNWLEKQSNKV